MGNGTDGLIVTQARHEATIHNLENAPFGFDRSIGGLVEKTPHLSVTFRGAMTGRLPRTFLVSRTDSYPRAEILVGGKRGRLGSYFGQDLLGGVNSQTGHLG